MGNIFSYLKDVPAYLQHVWQTMPMVVILVCAVFIISLFSGRIPGIIRKIFIIACIVYALIGGFTRRADYGRQIVWVAALLLLALALIRGIILIIQTSRQNKINAKIEERALEKAARRRGSFHNKQGYSGSNRPEPEYTPEKMNSEEIEALVKGEDPEKIIRFDKASDDEALKTLLGSENNTPLSSPRVESPSVSSADIDIPGDNLPEHLSADELYSMMNRLSDLHGLGILTDEEFAKKKAELLKRV